MGKNMKLTKTIMLLMASILNANLAYSFVTVGTTPDCDYDNLFPAYNDLDIEVRVTSEQVYANNFTFEKSKVFKGGYDTCADAEKGIIGDNNSRWSGLNSLNNTVIEMNANAIILNTVIIESFDIFDGRNLTFAGAGGIKVTGNSHLILRNSNVFDNQGNEGGGIRVTGSDAQVTVSNTRIYNNSATGFGGGVYCEDSGRFNLLEESAINNNNATQKGGGIFANSDCQIDAQSGDTFPESFIDTGVFDNMAETGGGVYLQGGADLLLTGNSNHPATVSENIATLANGPGGGGIYLTGQGTTVVAQNAYIKHNEAILFGGGIVVDDFASFRMSNLESHCQYEDYCSSLSSNFTTAQLAEGGAGYISNVATAIIAQTHINDNKSNLASTFAIREVGILRLESNLITNNGPFNTASALDLFSLDGSSGNGANLDFFSSTLSDNNANAIFFLDGQDSQQTINIFNSIIWDSGNIYTSLGQINPTSRIDCSILHELQSLPGNTDFLLSIDPRFRNANNGDYRLIDDSAAIDLCDEALFTHLFDDDIKGVQRGIDVGYINNVFGPYDAGAHSQFQQSPDVIFRNGFE